MKRRQYMQRGEHRYAQRAPTYLPMILQQSAVRRVMYSAWRPAQAYHIPSWLLHPTPPLAPKTRTLVHLGEFTERPLLSLREDDYCTAASRGFPVAVMFENRLGLGSMGMSTSS